MKYRKKRVALRAPSPFWIFSNSMNGVVRRYGMGRYVVLLLKSKRGRSQRNNTPFSTGK